MPNPKVMNDWLDTEQREIQRLIREREGLSAEIAKHEQIVAHLKTLITLQNGGAPFQQMPLKSGRFKGVSLRDAILIVLREQKQAPLDSLVNSMIAGGFDFDGRSPKRTVFLALSNMAQSKDSLIERDGTNFQMKEGAA